MPFAAEHLERVVVLEAEAYEAREAWPRSTFEHELVAPFSLWRVALEGESLAGYAGGWMVAGEFHLHNLVVAPAFRRRGLGAALLAELLSEAAQRGCRECTLEVRRGNAAARALYERAGFSPEGERRKYYPDGEDAIRYALALKPPER